MNTLGGYFVKILELKEHLIRNVSAREDEIIGLLTELVKIPSENPPGDMSDIAGFIDDFMKDNGLSCKKFEPQRGKISLICELGKSNSQKNLVLNGHMDVVPAGDLRKWKIPPYAGVIKDGYLFGRGASDMKGGLAGIIFATILLSEIEDLLNGTLTLMLVPDEETGGKFGTSWLLENEIVKPTAAIVAEPSTLELLDIGQKGRIWIKLIVKGEATHASFSTFLGDNAIVKACKVINSFYQLPKKIRAKAPLELEDVIKLSKRIARRDIGHPEADKIIESLSVNIGTISGGIKPNVVPDACILEFDIRIPIGVSKDQILQEIMSMLSEYNDDIEVLKVNGYEPNYTTPQEKIVQIVISNIKKYIGTFLGLYVDWASSDAKHFRKMNIPTVQYGPCHSSGIHGYNERVKLKDVVLATKVYLASSFDFLTTQ